VPGIAETDPSRRANHGGRVWCASVYADRLQLCKVRRVILPSKAVAGLYPTGGPHQAVAHHHEQEKVQRSLGNQVFQVYVVFILLLRSFKRTGESTVLCHFIDPAKFGGDDDDDDKDDGEGNEIDSIVDVVKAIVKLGQKNVELRDEFYSQVCKVVNGNKDKYPPTFFYLFMLKFSLYLRNSQMSARGWYLMGVCLGCFAPSQAFEPYIEQFILYNGLFGYEHYNWRGLRRLALSPRHRLLPPSRLELAAAIAQAQCSMPVLLANGHSVTIVVC